MCMLLYNVHFICVNYDLLNAESALYHISYARRKLAPAIDDHQKQLKRSAIVRQVMNIN